MARIAKRNIADDGSRYDTDDRTEYMARYYENRRDTLNNRAKTRYRNNREELATIARNKYKPKYKRHAIYR